MHFRRVWAYRFVTFRVYLCAAVSILTSIILKRPIVGHVQCVYFFIVSSQHIFCLSLSLSVFALFFLTSFIFLVHSKGFGKKKVMSRNEFSCLNRWCCCFSVSFTSVRLFSISIRHLFGYTWNWSKTRWCHFVFGQPLKTRCCGYVCCACAVFGVARALKVFFLKIGVNIV